MDQRQSRKSVTYIYSKATRKQDDFTLGQITWPLNVIGKTVIKKYLDCTTGTRQEGEGHNLFGVILFY